jgi:aldehyde dehydrogenase (NAD+)
MLTPPLLQPSEVSANTAKLLAEVLGKALDPETYATVNGAIPETTALLDQRFEHIFYTGNGTVGRIIQEKAAKWLCPVSLELGGKSPVIVDESANLSIVAKRVMWGKSVNAGQTCIAPDYVVCTKATQDKLVEEFKKAAEQFWPKGSNGSTKDYARIVNEGHWKRLASVLEGTKGNIVVGGETDQATKYIAPTVVANCNGDDPLMAGELFGPILPIVPVASIDEAINFINARDQPLALYPFGNNAVIKHILDSTRSGGVVVGDVMLHYVVGQLPFGGTGPSGYGAYHGKTGFDTFSHHRSCLIAPHTGIMGSIVEKVMTMRYPPYTDANLAKVRRPLLFF